jgi:HAD superfamily hydrolase (TIGR01509 family)
MKRHIFFDLDGVILDSMKYHARAWIEAFSQLGLSFSEEEIYLHEGAIELDTARTLFTSRGVNPTREFFESAFRLQKRLFLERYAKLVKPYPKVPDLLESLKKNGRKLALVTSSHAEILEKVFPKSLEKFFDVILTGDKVPRRKPHPDPYLRALSTLQADKGDSLVVENAPAGIKSAKSAGLFCVAIKTTLPEEHLKLADLIAEDHTHLSELLLNGSFKSGGKG